jgi:endonuclease YncB( thermonuclease family)
LVFARIVATAAEYTGPVVGIVDGDTFDMRSGSGLVRVRLCGVNPPARRIGKIQVNEAP